MTPEQRAAVIEEAKSWLRTPYHHHGRIKGAGVDCATLLLEVYSKAGLVPDHDLGNYSPQWHLHRTEEKYLLHLLQYCDEVAAAVPGGVVVFQFGRTYSHGAIVVEWPLVIHAMAPPAGGMCEWGDATQGRLASRSTRFFDLKAAA